jgi:DNA-binding response OmpR family regulator
MRKRILFVDDEDWSVTPYFPKLQDNDVKVELARDGEQALELLRKEKYDLIVLDIMLPAGNGFGRRVEPRKAGAILLEMIRRSEISNMKTPPDVPVVVLTAVTDQKLSDKIKQLDVTEIFQKPAAFEEVTEKLLALLKTEKAELA